MVDMEAGGDRKEHVEGFRLGIDDDGCQQFDVLGEGSAPIVDEVVV